MRARLRKDGRYEARARIDSETRLSGYGKTEREAIEDLERKAGHLLQSENLLKSPTLRWFWETNYLPTVQGKSPKWIQQIGWALSHLKPFHNKLLTEITRAELQAHLNRLKLGTASKKHIRKVLHAVLTLAEIDGLIPSNPARHLKLPRQTPTQKAVVEPTELRKLIGKAKDTKALAILVLGGLMGLRLGEMQRLEAKHFSKRGRLTVPGTKTDSAPRELPLDPRIVQLLFDRTFPLVSPTGANALRALKIYGKHLNPQLLRHSFNTGLQELGCPPEIRRMLMGHNLEGVQRVYSHGKMMEQKTEWLTKWVNMVLGSNEESLGVTLLGGKAK